ncbi:MAG: hypothetical protein IKG03_01895 [Clostridiales bacterium]|nr:hypothetical protein [Clostridiales bacterium]
MIKQVTAIILISAMCLPLFACGSGNKYKTSGKPYINEDPSPGIYDGFHYHTEENQTDNFIAYRDGNGEVMLYIMRHGNSSPYSPDGLCNVTPGKAYTITYDAQLITGGVGGVHDYYFLTVYDYSECSYDKLFENGYGWNSDWDSDFPMAGGLSGEAPYVAFKSTFGGYDVFSAKNGKTHYSSMKEVTYPVEINGVRTDLQFNVFCNWTLSESYITDKLIKGEYDDDPEFVFIDCYHSDGERGTSDNDFDTLEKLATGSKFYNNVYRFTADQMPDEGRRVISYEEMETKTAEELGLEDWLYGNIYYGWSDRAKGRWSDYNDDDGPAKKCDVLILTGNFESGSVINYDKDLRLYVNGSHPMDEDAGDNSINIYVIFIRSEFNDLIPQG